MPAIFTDNGKLRHNNRKADYNIDEIFINRWSPRAYDPDPIPKNILMSIFEAARWTMSCYNEQPWRFMIATEPEDRELILSTLVDFNQTWVKNAPVIGYIIAAKHFERNGKPNQWAEFDAGAAWMAMTLQARKMGLYTHGMAGFDQKAVYDKLNIPEDKYKVIAAFTIGKYGDPDKLDDDMKKSESPNGRRPLSASVIKGTMK